MTTPKYDGLVALVCNKRADVVLLTWADAPLDWIVDILPETDGFPFDILHAWLKRHAAVVATPWQVKWLDDDKTSVRTACVIRRDPEPADLEVEEP